jgi:hypothetical protein
MDLNHFGKLVPGANQSGKLYPDPHQSEAGSGSASEGKVGIRREPVWSTDIGESKSGEKIAVGSGSASK